MVSNDRPKLNPERTCAEDKYLVYRHDRVVDPKPPEQIRPDEVFHIFPNRRVHGVLIGGSVHNPAFKNIHAGEPAASPHHNKDKNREWRTEDYLGDNPE